MYWSKSLKSIGRTWHHHRRSFIFNATVRISEPCDSNHVKGKTYYITPVNSSTNSNKKWIATKIWCNFMNWTYILAHKQREKSETISNAISKFINLINLFVNKINFYVQHISEECFSQQIKKNWMLQRAR